MVKLTPLKIRRMSLGLRQIDVVMATGISPSRYSSIENELTRAGPVESERIESFLQRAQSIVEQAPPGLALAAAAKRNLICTDRVSAQEPRPKRRLGPEET